MRLKIENVFEKIIKNIKDESPSSIREKILHGRQGEIPVELYIYDFFKAELFYKIYPLKKKLKILWIENNPEQEIKEIDKRLSTLPEKPDFFEEELQKIIIGEGTLQKIIVKITENIADLFLIKEKEEIEKFVKNLREAWRKDKKEFAVECKKLNLDSREEKTSININEIDFMLIDIYLDVPDIDGIEISNLLREVAPHIPVFMLTICDDHLITRKTIKGGADFHINKREFFSIPYIYNAYIKETGKIVDFIEDEKLRRSLLGNIRYWNFKKNYLWFGDKCYHMIEHAFNHTSDNWNNMNKILVPLLRNKTIREFLSESQKGEFNKLLYSFSMAIWLHDIGHKGNHRYGEPHLIRETHGIISAEYILNSPEAYGIVEMDEKDGEERKIYKNMKFPLGEGKKTLVQILKETLERRKRILNTELIALFSFYHKSNTPATREEYYSALNKGSYIPIDLYENCDRSRDVTTFEDLLDKLENKKMKDAVLSLLALFRFIDGLDISIKRVGDPFEHKMRLKIIENDYEYTKYKLETLVKKMSSKVPKDIRSLFIKNFYLDVIEKLERKESASLKELIKEYKDFEEMEEYLMLCNYLYFLKAQPTHILLHSSVEDMEIIYNGRKEFEIILYTSKTEEELKNEKVFEVGKPEESIYERLIGENCYIKREFDDVKKYLKNFIEGIEIKLKNQLTGKIIRERTKI